MPWPSTSSALAVGFVKVNRMRRREKMGMKDSFAAMGMRNMGRNVSEITDWNGKMGSEYKVFVCLCESEREG